MEERSPRILASWLWEGNIKFLSAFAVTARLCSHLCLLSPSTCSHRVFLFSFPFCGWRCPFLGTRGHMQLWHTALGTSEQEGFGVLAWVHSRNSLMWEDCPLFSPQPAGDQPSTCCSRRADDGILRQAEDFIPGGHPLQEEACADEPCKETGPSPLFSTNQRLPTSSGTDITANSLVQSLGSAAEAPSISSEPVASMTCFSWCLLLLCLWRLFLGRGMQNVPSPNPETAIVSSSKPLAGCFGGAETPRTHFRGTNLYQPPHGNSRL